MQILEPLVLKFGDCDYTIGRELHVEKHADYWHAWFSFYVEVNTTDPRAFDILGVHPNIINPGKGWEPYCVKEGDYITNHWEKDPFDEAAKAASCSDGLALLWNKRPQDMLKYGEAIERNLRRRLAPMPEPTLYYGPYPGHFHGFEWSPYIHSLLLWGEPGTNKTQFARYLLSHMFGEYEYVKGRHEMWKTHCSRTKPVLHDEVYLVGKDPELSKEITDVESGGNFDCRNSDCWIPPGIVRIFVSNYEFPFHNPKMAVYGRRVQSYEIK